MTPYERDVAKRAYSIWASNGCQPGTDREDWVAARAELSRAGLPPPQGGVPPGTAPLLWAILENSPAVIYAKNTEGRYLLVNSRFETLFGVSRAEVVGKSDRDVFLPEHAAALRANDLEVITTGLPREFEEVVRQEDGEHTYLSLKFPVAGPGGRTCAVCGISTDITERVRTRRCLVLQHAVTRTLAESATPRDACPGVLRALCDGLGWDIGLLWLVGPCTDLLDCVGVWHPPAVEFPNFGRMSRDLVLPAGVDVPGRILASGRPVWIPDIGAAELPRAAAALQDGLHAGYGFPVRNGGEMLGVIEVLSREVRPPDPDQARLLDGVGSQLSQFIERREAERTLHQREREFAVARQIQLGLLPKAAPVVPGFAIGGATYPAQETGGDFYDFIRLADGALGVAIGDASGHGVGAALVIAQTRAYLRAWGAAESDVGEVLKRVNRQLEGDLPEGHFVTLFLARLDLASRSVSYSSAGHWPGYVLDDRGAVRVLLESTGLPLGIDHEADYPVSPAVPLSPGDLILLLTDGLVETHTPDGAVFGIGRVMETVRGCRGGSPTEIVTALRRAGHAFSENQTDDVTAVVIKVGSQGGVVGPAGARG